MEKRAALIVTGLIILLIIGIILGTIYYLGSALRRGGTRPSPTPSVTANQQTTPSPGGTAAPGSQNTVTVKYLNVSGLVLQVPKEWGVLRCTNSANFELDPTNAADQNINCDTAIKPITVLVGASNCRGSVTSINGMAVIKDKRENAEGPDYQWCTQTSPVLNITHRVSNKGSQATSRQDYSTQIEQLISNIRVGGVGGS